MDFVEGAVAHRRKFGGGRGQSIAKAVGLKSGAMPTVVDATAGLGRDAFVLASLGCKVTLIERSPVVAALLQDGLARAAPGSRDRLLGQRAHASPAGACGGQPAGVARAAEVIYLDPMFPHKQKSALVKGDAGVPVPGGAGS